ncbi:Dual specificity protein phosphatase 10 [Clydaea vesicula]|uniref:protein-tyrosine-phosphatase n=1 Tax=Clydaea vesicula TaxID=447962 RepID=A0AAD5TZM1_9FUNG|nr:Dual specificity protein phosphatase 10 [Clydaea vesicula]
MPSIMVDLNDIDDGDKLPTSLPIPESCNSDEMFQIIKNEYLNTLFLDLTFNLAHGHLPGSYTNSLIDLDCVSQNDVYLKRRIDRKVVVFDEEGSVNGWAYQCCQILLLENKVESCCYLKGGLRNFNYKYGYLTKTNLEEKCSAQLQNNPNLEFEWVNVNEKILKGEKDQEFISKLDDTDENKENKLMDKEYAALNKKEIELINSDYNINFENGSVSPVYLLKLQQKHLVNSVWYGKRAPYGDLPIMILPHLFLGSSQTASKELVKKYNIKHILRLGWGFIDECDVADGIIYHDFPIEDTPSQKIEHLFVTTSKIIENARLKNERILVHCYAGVSRSSTIVLSYLINYHNLTLFESFKFVYLKRPIIRPNLGFTIALQRYELKKFKNLDAPTLDKFWICESFIHFLNFLDIEFRINLHTNEKNEKDSSLLTDENFEIKKISVSSVSDEFNKIIEKVNVNEE